MSEQGIRKSVMYRLYEFFNTLLFPWILNEIKTIWLGIVSIFSDGLDTEQETSFDILKEDQKNFIAEAVDVEKMTEASREFRRKFDFFLRANKLLMSLANEKTRLALDKGKQQSIKIRAEAMLCGIPPFYSPNDWCNALLIVTVCHCEFWKNLQVNFECRNSVFVRNTCFKF